MMPQVAELHTLTATEVIALLKEDTITVLRYARALLARIEERNHVVKAWAHLDEEHILSQACTLDQIPRAQRGPLHGVGVAIKDTMDTRDMPTEFGSALYQGHRPGVDASPVSILRSAGALIIGKTTTTEFTLVNSGLDTTNPHDSNRTPGGSSTGSAAAVADFQVPLSLGTQSHGSIIRPASYTGIFAMKPTMHAISTDGVKIVSTSVDTVGFFARSVEDLQLVADIFNIGGKDDEINDVPVLTEAPFALVRTSMWQRAGPGTIKAMETAAHVLRMRGMKVEEAELPSECCDVDTIFETHETILNSEAGASLLKEYRMDKTKLGSMIRHLVENRANVTHRQTVAAMDRYGRMRPSFDKFAARYTAIITPSAEDVAPLGLDNMGAPSFNFLWTGLHTPTINIPAFVGEEGLPVGLSIVTGRFRDRHLLRICKMISEPLMAAGGWTIVDPAIDAKL